MNYLKEINGFERWVESNPISTASQLLYYKLLMRFNKARWVEWLSIDNCRLMADAHIGNRGTLTRARNVLIKAGIIEMKTGKKGCPNQYRLISFEREVEEQSADEGISDTEMSNKCCTKSGHENNTNTGSFLERVAQSVTECVSNSVPKVDTIYKHKTKTKNLKSNSKELPETHTSETEEFDQILELYNKTCTSLEPLTKLTAKQKRGIKACLKAGKTISDFERLFAMAENSEFLKGNNSYGWSANFDWLIRKGNMEKVFADKYKNPDKARSASNGQPKKNGFHNFEERKTDYGALVMQNVLGWLGASDTQVESAQPKEAEQVKDVESTTEKPNNQTYQDDLQAQFAMYGMPSFAF